MKPKDALFAGMALLVSACATQPAADPPVAQVPPPEVVLEAAPSPDLYPDYPPPNETPTLVKDRAALARLISNSGLTLQWIGWEQRGYLGVFEDRGEYFIDGSQTDPNNDKAALFVNGRIVEIGTDYFTFDGTIRIFGTPDAGRSCTASKKWRFAITQGRKYWRLREFEWCDGLTDYIDIYF